MSHRFLLDGMLGATARWLRICGYDAEYQRNIPDEELIRRATEEDRALLTSDKLLYGKAVRGGVEAFLVDGESNTEKLASISRRFGLELNPEVSRCPKCGVELTEIEKKAVEELVPRRTFEAYDEFWICEACRQVYWKGSHWRNIVETLERASRLAQEGFRG